MRRLLITTILTTACATGPLAAAGTGFAPAQPAVAFDSNGPETLWLAKNDKDDKGKDKKAKKKDKQEKKAEKKREKREKQAEKHKEKKAKKDKKDDKIEIKTNGDKVTIKGDEVKIKGDEVKLPKGMDRAEFDERVTRFTQDRETVVTRLLNTPAPEGRDMAAILGAAALALAAPELNAAALPEDELITYRNCPPGLAKKDPPCVPPGLAKQGVTYEQWASYSDDELDTLLEERRQPYLEADPLTERELLLLESHQIAQLYSLDAAPAGHRYALIDGQPVLLSNEDHTALLRINELARVPTIGSGVNIAPTAALTQADLINLYRLPEPEEGYNYAVLNGQVISLRDSAYETLQLIRIARAVL